MRKILTSVLSVAGLLAVVLAIASPATAQEVVVFTTDTEPGTYTVSWETQGGCDPSSPDDDTTLATDGASGSISRTVNAPANTPDDAAVGNEDAQVAEEDVVQFSVATADHCNYEWSASFTSSLPGSNGIGCAIDGARDGALGIVADQILTVSATICNSVGTIVAAIPRNSTTNDDDEVVPTQPQSGAVLNTTFTVTATPVDDSNDECAAVTEETEVDDQDNSDENDDTVSASLTVLNAPLSEENANCEYDVTVDVPGGFEAANKGDDEAEVESFIAFTADPAEAADDDEGGVEPMEATDCGEIRFIDNDDEDELVNNSVTVSCRFAYADVSFALVVAERDIYVLQRVTGPSGDGVDSYGTGRYSLTDNDSCGIPGDIPIGLSQRTTGGIMTTGDSVTVVELREGFFNITGAVLSPVEVTPDFDPAARYALNAEADECVMTAEVIDLPDGCSAEASELSGNMVSGVDDRGRAIMSFSITCAASDDGDDASDDSDASDASDASDDMGDMGDDNGDDNGDDMGDMGDDNGDDMGDMGDDNGDDIGPPEDVATG